MPYRRLPNTDASRLRALKAVIDNDEIYTVRNRFIEWETINRAHQVYERLLTAVDQYRVNFSAQRRGTGKGDKLQRNAMMYVSHFLQVLLMSVERGEIKRSFLPLYGIDEDTKTLPNLKSIEGLFKCGDAVIKGEKARMKAGGRPIYNPTIGMVSTHLDIFRQSYEQQKRLRERTNEALKPLRELRPEVDAVLLELWNQIEAKYKDLPVEERIAECKKLGVVYYNRKNEKTCGQDPH